MLAANQVGLAVSILAVVVGAASLVVRFRHAVPWNVSSCGGWRWRRRRWR